MESNESRGFFSSIVNSILSIAASLNSTPIIKGFCSHTSVLSSAQSTTSTSYIDVTGASTTISVNGGALSCMLSLPFYCNGREAIGAININGVDYYCCDTCSLSAVGSIVGFCTIPAGVVPAGSYTVKARFKISNTPDTATIMPYTSRSFSVVEI